MLTLGRSAAVVTLALAIAVTPGVPSRADNGSLIVEQVGNYNRAVSYQGSVPTVRAIEHALEVSPNTPLFDVLNASDVIEEPNFTFHNDGNDRQSINELLEDFQGLPSGANNVAEVRQDGFHNKALNVQLGSNNRMLTKQDGNRNIGVHLQRGSDNNTELVQIGDRNQNALVAEGGAVGKSGPLRLQARGGVEGFSIRASGSQNFNTALVEPNLDGGLNIELKP